MIRQTRLYRKMIRLVGQAIEKYAMIEHGDRILVALSGGKDSMAMIHFLRELQAAAPVHFDLFPVYVDPGFQPGFNGEISAYCATAGFPVRIEKTDFGIRAHSEENRENPCFLCAMLRRRRLFEVADEMECRKLALGHTRDDLIETLFLNMFYAGEISTMVPAQSMFRDKYTIIRPLAFVDETMTKAFAKEADIPVFHNSCPTDKTGKRSQIKEMLQRIYDTDPNIKGNLFRSMSRCKPEYLLK